MAKTIKVKKNEPDRWMNQSMMFALLICLLLLWCDRVNAAITEVGSGTQRAGTTCGNGIVASCDLAFPGNATNGNLLIVGGVTYSGSGAPASIAVTSTCSSALTVLSAVLETNRRFFLAYGKATSSAACTVTVDPTGSSYISYGIDEFSGQDPTTPLDVDGGSATGSGTTPTMNITTGVANALIVGVQCDTLGVNSAITEGSGYTKISEGEDGSNYIRFALEFKIVTTATTYAVDWTIASSTWGVYSASFKPYVASSIRHRVIQ